MFWSLRRADRHVSVFDELAQRYLSTNGSGNQTSTALDTCGNDEVQTPPTACRQAAPSVLVPMMIGSQMILTSRSEQGVRPDWPTSIPAKE
jgi:hypothetical protein